LACKAFLNGVKLVDTQSSVFDRHGLREAEEAYRFVLGREPGDMDTRVNLAWCLLLQAIYQSGQETLLAEHPNLYTEDELPSATPILPPGPDARHLLQECLRHSLTVRHLSAREANQIDVEKLEALVLLAGGKELLLSNEEIGVRIRNKFVEALHYASD
jgi:hypothetical protein